MLILLLLCFLPVLFAVLPLHAADLSPELQLALSSLRDQDELPVIVTLSEKADLREIRAGDRRLLRSTLIRALKEKADVAQRPIRSFLEVKRARKIKPLWLINGIAVTAPAGVIHELANVPGVDEIRLDGIILAPVFAEGTSAAPEWNLNSIRAPELWNLGHTGTGVVVAAMDTGVDVQHPDLQGRWRGGTNSWYDPHGEHHSPHDAHGHGTQVMGVLVGGDAGGTAIGVSPGARWIAVKIFNDQGEAPLSAIHQGFQWLLDPDDNPDTDDAPDIVNNSWGLENVNGCSLEFQADLQTLKAAGVAVVFAAGNSGPGGSTSISPANNPEGFAIGSVNQSLGIASSSSRGPSACDGRIFPEVVAPGVSVRTADLTLGGLFPDSYRTVSGTSFAAPHVAGVIALLLSAFPGLTVSELETVLKQSAFDLGATGADYAYGYGLIDVREAYYRLQSPVISVSPSFYDFGKIAEGRVSTPQTFTVTNQGSKDLMVDIISISGTDFSQFLVLSDACSGQVVVPTASCTVQVVFEPAAGGPKSADLLIPSNDPAQSSYPVTLNGRGIERYTLKVTTLGAGAGKAVSEPRGIDCGIDCSQIFRPGSVVNLQAVPEGDSGFAGWSGCTSSSGRTCQVRMGRDKTVTGTFVGPSLTLTSPRGGESWKAGTTRRIKWTFTGRPGAYVKIELLEGDAVIKTIAEAVPRGSSGIGYFDWYISRKLQDGAAYKVRITSIRNNTYTDASDLPFAIHH